jgi:hypothetical protein
MFTAMAIGGIAAYFRMSRQGKARKEEGEPTAEELAQRNEAARQKMLRAVLYAVLSTTLLATLAIPIPALGNLVPLPGPLVLLRYVTVPAVALAAFSYLLVMAANQLRSFFNSRAPADQKQKNDAYGIFQAVFITSSIFALAAFKFPFVGELPFGFKPVAQFAGLDGAWPFVVAAILILLMASAALWVRFLIDRSSRPAKNPS